MYTLGIDEVGRGPLAGPVTLALFARNKEMLPDEILLSLFPKKILRDSKKLSKKEREAITQELELLKQSNVCAYFLASRSAQDIDERGISACIKECIAELLEKAETKLKFDTRETKLFLDGSLFADKRFTLQETIIKGDEKILEIACASIIAKVDRDTVMEKEGINHPLYRFEKHMGYGTKEHRGSIQQYGPCALHRKTYIKKCLKENS